MQKRIEAALGSLQPLYLQVEDESHDHQRGRGTHYKAVVVSDCFNGLSRVQRHQTVYAALDDLLNEFHAIALYTFTAQEWQERREAVPDSPECRGGSRLDRQVGVTAD